MLQGKWNSMLIANPSNYYNDGDYLDRTKSAFVMVDGGQEIGTTTISYSYPMDVRLFESFDGGAWIERPLVNFDQARAGSWTQPIRPGMVYSVIVFDRFASIDAKQLRWPSEQRRGAVAEPLDVLTLRGIRDRVNDLLGDSGHDWGGTFFGAKLTTGSMVTYAVMQLGKEPPLAAPDGFNLLPNPTHTIRSEGVEHEILFPRLNTPDFPLVPGHRYFALAIVTDNRGRWQSYAADFTTKLRVLTIKLDNLTIINDSDDASAGDEGNFYIQIYETGSLATKLLREYHHYLERFVDEPAHNSNVYPLDGTFEYHDGPTVVSMENPKIGFTLRGIEVDGWLETDDIAETSRFTGPQNLRLPIGRQEHLTDAKATIHAYERQPDDNFEFDLNLTYSVSYV